MEITTYEFGKTRIEVSPTTDWWMRGARYGTVIGIVRSGPRKNHLKVKLDEVVAPIRISHHLVKVIA